MMDQQTDVRRSAGFAAIVQAWCRLVDDGHRAVRQRALRRAARRSRATPPDPAEVAALAELIPGSELVDHVLRRPEAERQLELGPEAALLELASRS